MHSSSASASSSLSTVPGRCNIMSYKFHKSHKANPSYIGGVTIVKTESGELSATVCLRCDINNLNPLAAKKCQGKKEVKPVVGIPIKKEDLNPNIALAADGLKMKRMMGKESAAAMEAAAKMAGNRMADGILNEDQKSSLYKAISEATEPFAVRQYREGLKERVAEIEADGWTIVELATDGITAKKNDEVKVFPLASTASSTTNG